MKKLPFKELKAGFQGVAGFRYHPTKGYRKEVGFVPLSAREISDRKAKAAGIAA